MRVYKQKRDLFRLFTGVMVVFLPFASGESYASRQYSVLDVEEYKLPRDIPYPEENKPTQERIDLGRILFFDPRLSRTGATSCATCHNPVLGWSDGLSLPRDRKIKKILRAVPSLNDVAYQTTFYWDGRANALEAQVLDAFKSAEEMDQPIANVVKYIKNNPAYVDLFEHAYPGEQIDKTTLAKAIASFERSIISQPSAFDRWLGGDEKALSESAINGFNLFKNKARCVSCHKGFSFSDQGFHNIGLKEVKDDGRGKIEKNALLKGAFKTPGLRNVTRSAPYMHNTAYANLDQVIEHYNRGGDGKTKDALLKKLGLTKQEKQDLIAFLKSLTDDRSTYEVPVLPVK